MNPEQKAAFVIAQAACAMAEIAAMQAQDRIWLAMGHGTHSDLDYAAVSERFCIGHNAVLTLFEGQ